MSDKKIKLKVDKKKGAKKVWCIGKKPNGEPCKCYGKDGTKFCLNHKYQLKYTEDEFNKLEQCRTCSSMKLRKSGYVSCADCIEAASKKRKKGKQNNNSAICQGFGRGNESCKSKVKDGNFCARHKFQSSYTEIQLKNLKECTGCHNMRILEELYGKNKTRCNKCVNRVKKVVNENKVLCSVITNTDKQCQNKGIIELDKKMYCNFHIEKVKLVKNLKKDGLVKCSSRYGCGNTVKDGGSYLWCKDCRKRDSKQSKNYRKTRILHNMNQEITIMEDEIMGNNKEKLGRKPTLICVKCNTKFKFFLNDRNKRSDRCLSCLNKMREYSKNRQNRLERFTENDVVREVKRCAKDRNKNYELTDEDIIHIVYKLCIYCGKMSKRNFNSIDRRDNNKGYIKDNIDVLCIKCNFMKYNYTVDDFIKYCYNIKNNYGSVIEKDKLLSDSFIHKLINRSKNDCKRKKKERNIKFLLSYKETEEVVKYKCYYCNDSNMDSKGIDRIDSSIGYTVENSRSSCKICNYMKNDSNEIEFKKHIHDICNFLDKQNKIYDVKKIPKIIEKEWLFKQILHLMNSIKNLHNDDKNKVVDNRNIYTLKKKQQYYIDNIYNGDIKDFSAELEFCDNEESLDKWMFYRLKVSSFRHAKHVGRDIKILVKDKKTGKYVGISSLSSDIRHCYDRDNFIGWEHKKKRLNNILNITTCVSIPPFSYNYNGGKLVTMLMFSKEVYDYYWKKYKNKLGGITTFSLYGKSIQYDRLKRLKLIGYTNGFGSSHIPKNLYKCMIKYMDKENIDHKKYNGKIHKITLLMRNLHLKTNILRHGIERGIYFGFTGENAKMFLNRERKTFKHNLDSVYVISNEWKNRWAIKRYNHLKKNNRLISSFKSNNIIDNTDYYRITKRKQRAKNKTICKIYKQYDKEEVGKYILLLKKENEKLSLNKIAKKVGEKYNIKFDQKQVKRILIKIDGKIK
jgi:hypothetical protein